MTTGLFTPRAAVVEARRWAPSMAEEIRAWIGSWAVVRSFPMDGTTRWEINTLRGDQPLHSGDAIVRYREGVVDVYDFELFKQLFEPVVYDSVGRTRRLADAATSKMLSLGDRS